MTEIVFPSPISKELHTFVDGVHVMVSILALNVVDCGFEPQLGQTLTKDYKIGICWFYAKHTALRRKSKDCLAQNQDNVLTGTTCRHTDCCFSELAL